MNLHFITSISKNYWYETAQHCISTWDLPGKLTVYIDQKGGELNWLADVAYHKELLTVPELSVKSEDRAKVRKFWGKSWAQITALRNRGLDERVIWLDADVEQTNKALPDYFNFSFVEPVAMMNSEDFEDCWESGLVIFNQQNEKLNQTIRKYENAWRDEDTLMSLWRPYDAQVLGHVVLERGYYNLCKNKCKNVDALKNTEYNEIFKHHINKDNKRLLLESKSSK
jgi:hypothetical protein